ncbi:YcxB family protein [Cohnella lupini]|uniref:YcxB-like protein n=1 Tax=Cohnella lupini TaxID=1294267 RepID=A0A3D9ITH8_9BACL|nr:YcxB family protein [Cohnella lupini]RED65005.1 YcxB-like protein [Cohnella lupini]
MVEVTFKYNEYMSRALRDYHHHSLRFWISNIVGLGIVLAEIIAYFMTSNTTLLWIGLFVFVLIAVSYVTSCYLQPARYNSDPRYNKMFTMAIGDEVIRLTSDDVNSEATWEFVKKAWATDKFYYLFLGKRQFWIVPRDSFANKAQEEHFKQITERHRKINQGLIR